MPNTGTSEYYINFRKQDLLDEEEQESSETLIEHEGYQRAITDVVKIQHMKQAEDIAGLMEEMRKAIIEAKKLRGRLATLHTKRNTGYFPQVKRRQEA